MGRFDHFYAIEKKKLEDYQAIHSETELKAFLDRYAIEYDDLTDEGEGICCGPYNIMDMHIYDFGEADSELLDALFENGTRVFKDNEYLSDKYSDYDPYILEPEKAFHCAIKHYKDKVIKSLEDDLKEKSENIFEQHLSREERFIKDVQEKLRIWHFTDEGPLNSKKDCVKVTTSWRYEYAYFNLVAEWKAFDNKKYALIFLNW